MYPWLASLAIFWYQGLPALSTDLYLGLPALSTFLYLGLDNSFYPGLQIMTSVITQYSSFVQVLQACKDSTLWDVTIIYF